MHRRLAAALLAALLALSLAACSQDQGAENPTPTPETVRIGLLLQGDGENAYDQNHIQGLQDACRTLGIDYDTQVLVRTGVPEDETCRDTIRELVDAGCQILFSASQGHELYLTEAAGDHPNLQVCQAVGTLGAQDDLDNPHDAYARLYEASYLAGIAAGEKTATNLLGYVAARPTAQVISAYTAYYLGAKHANPDVTMVVRYANTWNDAGQEAALAQGLSGDVAVQAAAVEHGAGGQLAGSGLPLQRASALRAEAALRGVHTMWAIYHIRRLRFLQ